MGKGKGGEISYMVSAEHIQTEQDIHRLVFQDGEGAWEENVLDFELCHVDSAHDFCGPNSLGNSLPAHVHQPGEATFLGKGETH